jgi:hypothetical protein
MDPTETLFPLATVMDHAGVPSEFLSIGVSMVTVHGPPGASAHARVRASSMRAFAGSAAGIRLSSFTYFIRRTGRPPGGRWLPQEVYCRLRAEAVEAVDNAHLVRQAAVHD